MVPSTGTVGDCARLLVLQFWYELVFPGGISMHNSPTALLHRESSGLVEQRSNKVVRILFNFSFHLLVAIICTFFVNKVHDLAY